MKILYRIFASPALAVLSLVTFAVSMAVATFVENDYGTATAWVLVYDAWWFEMIMLLMTVSFVFNIFKYKLLKKEKWAVLMFHLAFVLIMVGAAVTRYCSYGGVLRVREGKQTNTVLSTNNYVTIKLHHNGQTKVVQKKASFSHAKGNSFYLSTDYNNTPVALEYVNYIPDATSKIVVDSVVGKPILELVVSVGDGRKTIFLKEGEIRSVGKEAYKIGLNTDEKNVINIVYQKEEFKIKAPSQLDYFIMASQDAGKIESNTWGKMHLSTLYRFQNLSIVPLAFHPKGKVAFVSGTKKGSKENDKNKDDVLLLLASSGDQQIEVSLLYREGFAPEPYSVNLKGTHIDVFYGSKEIKLPFSIKLNDFQLDRYPGSTSPAAYASEVSVLDGDKVIPFRIFMNNVLDYKGYRFFQASYDTDEKGTVLSVNHDAIGTNLTYLGYLLMGLGMFFTLFGKGTRFRTILNKMKKLESLKVCILFIALFSSFLGHTQSVPLDKNVANFVAVSMDNNHSKKFEKLLVQDLDGRIKPIGTLASEFLRKISGKTYYKYRENGVVKKLNASQVFLALQMASEVSQNIPIIKVDVKKTKDVFKNLSISEFKTVAFRDLLQDDGSYMLSKNVEQANQKKPAERSEFDKEILKIDERFNILYNLFIGSYLKIFPNKLDTNDTWFTYTHHFKDFPNEDAQFAKSVIVNYFKNLTLKNWEAAEKDLAYISTYQQVLGKEIIPSQKRINAELLYNKLNLNFWLFQLFFSLGFVLLIFAVVRVFTHHKVIHYSWKGIVSLVWLGFLLFAANIILRWYIAQHAPWSNGYEMLVFVAWVLLLCGLVINKKSDFALPLATIFTGALLFVSYLDWLSPEITNLMPVLKSYWLKVHVATIVSSYAPLALSAVLGMMALLLMMVRTNQNKDRINIKIKELTYLNELAMTVGLFVLSIGTFLGGVWANESWGRYWAWDPKETWALISIIVYAVVLHLRLIPKLKNDYVLNMVSMFAFWSIIMTSFGVNYYLTGLHSYASGDPIPIPKFTYVIMALMILISLVAYYKNRQLKNVK
ncbi:cytochrome c-type biogenesis protein CcsB [Wenyingzhuangia heitensis]|uniref:Cytochrome c-type biogenesis protein CcsB n=1 Tax=Wenyingzhuangia heitensis TaxID=1487859 RepID=A0ABX0UAH2_9FLAO|nr:cytochrome c biogenesis protein CcsA [Wenyingzhuangia heitensis]NIJ45822.1 cytochrome c-type biogenesis protein CcsB [Wenyingzhuangia heitensis]